MKKFFAALGALAGILSIVLSLRLYPADFYITTSNTTIAAIQTFNEAFYIGIATLLFVLGLFAVCYFCTVLFARETSSIGGTASPKRANGTENDPNTRTTPSVLRVCLRILLIIGLLYSIAHIFLSDITIERDAYTIVISLLGMFLIVLVGILLNRKKLDTLSFVLSGFLMFAHCGVPVIAYLLKSERVIVPDLVWKGVLTLISLTMFYTWSDIKKLPKTTSNTSTEKSGDANADSEASTSETEQDVEAEQGTEAEQEAEEQSETCENEDENDEDEQDDNEDEKTEEQDFVEIAPPVNEQPIESPADSNS